MKIRIIAQSAFIVFVGILLVGCVSNKKLMNQYRTQLKSTDQAQAQEAINGIFTLKQEEADTFAPELIGILIKGTDDETRRMAIEALGAIRPQMDVDLNDAIIVAMNDRNAAIRRAAVVVVNELPNIPPTIINVLLKHLNDEDQVVRELAGATFEKMGKVGLHTLIHALDDPNDQMRLVAVVTLRRLGLVASIAVEQLKNLQSTDSNEDVRKAAEESLKHIVQ